MDGSQENNSLVCKPCQISEDIDVSLTRTVEKCQSLAIPNEFLCPISMEIMSDPVIVSTGQTYDRSSIQKWLDSAHMTCPKTRETLSHWSLAPNYALRSLITQWCEKNEVELQKEGCIAMERTFEHRKEISAVVKKLSSSHLDVQRKAIQQIRMLSKDNPYNRILIANSGGIPPLVSLLRSRDSTIQEHTVATLFNLSIDEGNKKLIAKSGAIPAIIEVLRHGNVEARENSAATLFSLSMLDENKVMIGSLNGIPPLVVLLEKGTIRGKKDAATALFNLSHNQSNKARAVKAGIVTTLLQLLTDKNLGMVDEALSILLLLSSNREGRNAIGKQKNIQILVELIKEGTAKNKECAIAVLLELGLNNSSHILASLQFGVYEHLIELSKSGTNRAQWKANSLLHHMNKSEQI